MKTEIKTGHRDTIQDNIDEREETSKTALIIGIVMATLVGLWGATCLIGGLASSGVGGLIKGYIATVIGG
jgi:hypothetical protein